jgi:hypothetical protein
MVAMCWQFNLRSSQGPGRKFRQLLEGQPEMGKTAIAWMISAVQLTQKWEAIDCDNPDDFFEGYSNSEKQIFIADDAFGTTEYETAR